jgi:hypothetical protein
MKITIDIPDSFKSNENTYVCIMCNKFLYTSMIEGWHGIQVVNEKDKKLLLSHLDNITDIIRKMVKEGLI